MLMLAFLAVYGIGATVVILGYASGVLSKRSNVYTDGNIEKLKNALLSYALLRTCKEDIDDEDFDYEAYDGSALPMFLGRTLEDACFSYITDYEDHHAFQMRTSAISKYIYKNLASECNAFEFFVKFLDKVHPGDRVCDWDDGSTSDVASDGDAEDAEDDEDAEDAESPDGAESPEVPVNVNGIITETQDGIAQDIDDGYSVITAEDTKKDKDV
jgi:hypothetical protein